MPRPSLWTIELTGRRQVVRQSLLATSLALAATVVVLQFLEQHKVGEEGPWHSTIADTDGASLVASMLVLAIALWATRGRLASGIAAAVITFAGGIVGFGFTFLAHLLSNPTFGAFTGWLMLANLALACLGLAFLVVELVLHVRERRQLEAPSAPLPAARLVHRVEG